MHKRTDGQAAASLGPTALAEATFRRLEAMRLQEIEGNPLDAEQIEMFEMFEREQWAHERRRHHILEIARTKTAPAAAE